MKCLLAAGNHPATAIALGQANGDGVEKRSYAMENILDSYGAYHARVVNGTMRKWWRS
ncbi:MAG: hypothetical protein ACLVHV_17030 [Oscillospiraceae bacterium]